MREVLAISPPLISSIPFPFPLLATAFSPVLTQIDIDNLCFSPLTLNLSSSQQIHFVLRNSSQNSLHSFFGLTKNKQLETGHYHLPKMRLYVCLFIQGPDVICILISMSEEDMSDRKRLPPKRKNDTKRGQHVPPTYKDWLQVLVYVFNLKVKKARLLLGLKKSFSNTFIQQVQEGRKQKTRLCDVIEEEIQQSAFDKAQWLKMLVGRRDEAHNQRADQTQRAKEEQPKQLARESQDAEAEQQIYQANEANQTHIAQDFMTQHFQPFDYARPNFGQQMQPIQWIHSNLDPCLVPVLQTFSPTGFYLLGNYFQDTTGNQPQIGWTTCTVYIHIRQ